MPNFYEYKVVPAPSRPAKVKGLRGTQDRFAHALADVMNELAADGWEYQRAETLPCDERSGLTGKTTNFQNVLVFRRAVTEESLAPPEVPDTDDTQEDSGPSLRGGFMRKKSKPADPDPEHTEPDSVEDFKSAAEATLTAPETDADGEAAQNAKLPS